MCLFANIVVMNSWHTATRKSVSVVGNARLSPGGRVSNATNNRYEAQLRIAAYRAITDLLAKNSLITKEEERQVRKRIARMQDALIRPNQNPHTHDRNLTTTQVISHSISRECQYGLFSEDE